MPDRKFPWPKEPESGLIPDTGFTHEGAFHADDVFTTAFLEMINPDIQITRGSCVPENFDGIVYDIGLGKFDHHQKDREAREDGTMYAAFGKVWREFAPALGFSEFAITKTDRDFIAPLDASDNGQCGNRLSAVIALYNPGWDSDVDSDRAFREAVETAKGIFTKELEYVLSVDRARIPVFEATKNREMPGILVLPQYMPYADFVETQLPDVKFVIFPGGRGGYNIHTVPDSGNSGKNRIPFPEQWLGNPDRSLGMTFCHPGNFLASAETQEQAVNIAEAAIRIFERKRMQSVPEQTESGTLKEPDGRNRTDLTNLMDKAIAKKEAETHNPATSGKPSNIPEDPRGN